MNVVWRICTRINPPFEGDRTPALVLIMAILVANDANIHDETILRQLAVW